MEHGHFAIGNLDLTCITIDLRLLDPFLSIVNFKTIRFNSSRPTILPIFPFTAAYFDSKCTAKDILSLE